MHVLRHLLDLLPGVHLPLSRIELLVLALQVTLRETILQFCQHIILLFLRDNPLCNETISIFQEYRLDGIDFPVHEWLGEHRLVQFIMAMLAVANDINDDVPLESLPELHGQLDALVHLLRTVGIHVQNGSTDSLGHFGAVQTSPCFPGGGGETDLVVGDDMDCSFCLITHQVLHLESLVDHSLPGEGCVSVDHDA